MKLIDLDRDAGTLTISYHFFSGVFVLVIILITVWLITK
jgi:hypothetical protein